MPEQKIADAATLEVIAKNVKLDPEYQELAKAMPVLKLNLKIEPENEEISEKYFAAKNRVLEIIKNHAEVAKITDSDSRVVVGMMLKFDLTAKKATQFIKDLNEGKDMEGLMNGLRDHLDEKENKEAQDKNELGAIMPTDLANLNAGRGIG